MLDLFNEAFGTQLQMLTLFNFAMALSVVLPEYSYLPPERCVPVTMAQLSMGLLNVGSLCLAGQRVATAAQWPLTLLGRPTSYSGGSNYHKTTSPSNEGEGGRDAPAGAHRRGGRQRRRPTSTTARCSRWSQHW